MSTSSVTAPVARCGGSAPTRRSSEPQATFDPEIVFAACARFDTAVEINCRPERQDPPDELLEMALEWGCKISIDTDAHAPGQLEWQNYGCDKAARHEIDPADIVNTWVGRRSRRLDRHPSDGLIAPRHWGGRPGPPVGCRPHVEEDEQAQDQRPPQEGEPRHEAERRSADPADVSDRRVAAARARRLHAERANRRPLPVRRQAVHDGELRRAGRPGDRRSDGRRSGRCGEHTERHLLHPDREQHRAGLRAGGAASGARCATTAGGDIVLGERPSAPGGGGHGANRSGASCTDQLRRRGDARRAAAGRGSDRPGRRAPSS